MVDDLKGCDFWEHQRRNNNGADNGLRSIDGKIAKVNVNAGDPTKWTYVADPNHK